MTDSGAGWRESYREVPDGVRDLAVSGKTAVFGSFSGEREKPMESVSPAPLSEALAFYEENTERFEEEYPDRWLLIHWSGLMDKFAVLEDAVGDGIRMFGRGPS